ncbi:sulfite exporter TauE/SafE family protein [Novosphingobium umbonatum]|uniref:Probable membrane transporter protein n=1 Tax=Novosphingobium umbonatum TaxID=1908524 RepID=A0A3S2Y7X3_9SPHN|nr:sulfite exporter TauE/SafE family protein [Novosphingobium umbonatum]RVU04309.1 sulfite exporter TauE/SafE family protein [Novosphingobium umbonatum]
MQFFEHFDGLHAIAGLLVGLLVGLTGVGGGSLMTPLLVLMFGVNPQTAVGTDLLYASITKTTGSAVHGWRETVDWKIVRRLAYGSVPAALITLAVLAQTGKVNPATQQVILVALAVLLGLTAVTVLFRDSLLRFAGEIDPMRPRSKVVAATILLGAVMGVTVTVSSVGAGAIGVTVLLMLYPRLPVVKVVGSDIAHAVPLTLVAGLGHWMIGDVNGVLLANLLVGSIPGVIVGSLLSTHAPDKVLRPLLAAVLVVSAWQLYLKTQKAEGAKPKPVATASALAK